MQIVQVKYSPCTEIVEVMTSNAEGRKQTVPLSKSLWNTSSGGQLRIKENYHHRCVQKVACFYHFSRENLALVTVVYFEHIVIC